MATFQGPGIRVLKQYQGQDGKTYVQLSTGETLATDSEDYRDYFAEGVLYGEDEKGNFYPQEGAHDLLKQYQQLTQQNTFENYMKPYFEDEMTGSIAKGLGQSMDKFWQVNESYKQNYDEQMRQELVNKFLADNPRMDDGETQEERGSYLDRLTRGLPTGVGEFIMNSGNAGIQPGYWSDFGRGIDSLKNEILPEFLGGGDRGLIRDIREDGSYTTGERNRKINDIETGQYGFVDRSLDQLGVLSPLIIPGKVVQSAYKDDYSLEDALMGNKNDANIVEDLVTDPLTYMSFGLGKAGQAGEELSSLVPKLRTTANENRLKNLLKLATEEPKRLIPGRNAKTQAALEEANNWSKEWYNAPETTERIEAIKKAFVDGRNKYLNSNTNLSPGERFLIEAEEPRVNDLWDGLKTNIKNETYNSVFQSDRNKLQRLLEGEPHLHDGNMGVSYSGLNDYTVVDEFNTLNKNGTQNFANRALDPKQITSTGVHEGNHGVFTPQMFNDAASPTLQAMFQDPFREAMKAGVISEYYTNPLEIYARIQELRKFGGIKPGQIVNGEEIEALRKTALESSQVKQPFLRNFNSDDMAKLMNRLPSVGAGIGVPAWLLNQQSESQDTEQ